MCERAVRAVLDTKAAVVRIVDAHPGLVVFEVVPALCVPGGAVKIWTSAKRKREKEKY